MKLARSSKLFIGLTALLAAAFVLALGAGSAGAVSPQAISVSIAPGTAAPPSTLANYRMTPFGADPQPLGFGATSVALPPIFTGHPLSRPTGSITFNQAVNHATIGAGWATWSHGYTGDVYTTPGSTNPNSLTISLPAKTGAFYLYVEPNLFGTFTVSATGTDATGHVVSTSISVVGDSGARYVGFYNTTGGGLSSIRVSAPVAAFGFAVGEFGISNQMLTKIT